MITQVLLYHLKFQTHANCFVNKKAGHKLSISLPLSHPPTPGDIGRVGTDCLYIFLYSAALEENLPPLLTKVFIGGNPVNCIILLDVSFLSYIMGLRPVLRGGNAWK